MVSWGNTLYPTLLSPQDPIASLICQPITTILLEMTTRTSIDVMTNLTTEISSQWSKFQVNPLTPSYRLKWLSKPVLLKPTLSRPFPYFSSILYPHHKSHSKTTTKNLIPSSKQESQCSKKSLRNPEMVTSPSPSLLQKLRIITRNKNYLKMNNNNSSWNKRQWLCQRCYRLLKKSAFYPPLSSSKRPPTHLMPMWLTRAQIRPWRVWSLSRSSPCRSKWSGVSGSCPTR
jgi:hypothetical protein